MYTIYSIMYMLQYSHSWDLRSEMLMTLTVQLQWLQEAPAFLVDG